MSSDNPGWIIENIVLDSLVFLDVLPNDARVIADVGSGAGVPGIPIAIVRPDLDLTLIEAKQRRFSFLSTVVRELALSHVSLVGARIEAIDPSYVGRFDAVVMRCAGNPDEMLPLVLPLLGPGGSLVMSSGPSRGVPFPWEAISVRGASGAVRWFRRYRKP